MQKTATINHKINKNNELIVDSVQIDTITDIYDGTNSNYETVFYYDIDKASGISVDKNYGGSAKIILKSEDELDYKFYHEEYVPLSMIFDALGIDDWNTHLKELLNDEKIYKEVEKRWGWINPISEEEYLELNNHN